MSRRLTEEVKLDRAASRLRNAGRLRQKFKRIMVEVENSVGESMIGVAQSIAADAARMAPRDHGDLADSIEYKLSSDKLSAVIGPAAKAAIVERTVKGSAFATRKLGKPTAASKQKLLQFFKGYWLEFGTKGDPARNIPPLHPRPFMQPAYDLNKKWATEKLRNAVNDLLKKASQL